MKITHVVIAQEHVRVVLYDQEVVFAGQLVHLSPPLFTEDGARGVVAGRYDVHHLRHLQAPN